MATEETPEVFTYRTRPAGDGRAYTWAKYDVDGKEVEVASQTWPTEPDAEKAIRSIISGADVLATPYTHSIDKDDNDHVVLETTQDPTDRSFGMAVKQVGTNEIPVEPTPATEAVNNDSVSPVGEEVVHTDAEQKAVDAAQAKADKEEADKEVA